MEQSGAHDCAECSEPREPSERHVDLQMQMLVKLGESRAVVELLRGASFTIEAFFTIF